MNSKQVVASVNHYFSEQLKNRPFFVEGQFQPTPDRDFFLLQLDGPVFEEVCRNTYNVKLSINLLVQVKRDDTNILEFEGLITEAHNSFPKCLPILKANDDVWFTMIRTGEIDIVRHGSPSADAPVLLASITARYFTGGLDGSA